MMHTEVHPTLAAAVAAKTRKPIRVLLTMIAPSPAGE
jgi:hypothetical protein